LSTFFLHRTFIHRLIDNIWFTFGLSGCICSISDLFFTELLINKTLILLVLLGFSFIQLSGQNLSNFHQKNVKFLTDVIDLDSLSIYPSSFKVFQDSSEVTDSLYVINYINGEMEWLGELPTILSIEYRTIQMDLSKTYYHKDSSLIHSKDTSGYAPIRFSVGENNTDLFYSSGLNKSGSISRGVSFGNNQDLSVNSSLNLQLSGKISDDISILASISDDNIPIQPQGNTQQLQDFDQVFIQLFTNKWKLTAGDFWLKPPNGYFLKYNKRAQGASFEYEDRDIFDKLDSSLIRTRASMAVSKGKFARNEIQGIENNQGPYRLIGSENETFIIVLSGTESVYIDGELLERGQQNDYVIDYNTAEITFTANRLITKDKRIKVEFQYSDKNYARSILETSTTIKANDWEVYFNVYSEQDAKNQPLQQELDEEDKLVLSEAGDNTLLAIVESIDSLGYDGSANRYVMKDSLGYEVLIYGTDESTAIYGVSFTDFGAGNGDYLQSDFSAFGKVFEWIAPDTIGGEVISNGTHRPVRILVTPKKRQVISAGFRKPLNENWKTSVELAYSNYDANTFSNKDALDNEGYGAKFILNGKHKLNKYWKLTSELNVESVSENFNRIERFRDVEFSRNWNVAEIIGGNQLLGAAKVKLSKAKVFELGYSVNSFLQDDTYLGLKNDWKLNLKTKLDVDFSGSYLTSQDVKNTNFYRHKSEVSAPVGRIRVGFKDERESNIFRVGDSTLTNSYAFYDYEFFLENSDSSTNKFRVFYRERRDQASFAEDLTLSTRAINPGAQYSLLSQKNNHLVVRSTLRILEIENSAITSQTPENSLLNRIEHRFKLLKGGIKSNMFYEVGSGLELRKEFSYVEVPAGQGVYAWIDYNQDGVKDLNEFEIAEFSDQAIFLRINLPSNEYIKVFSNQFTEILSVDFRNFVSKKSNLGKFIRRFNSQTSYRIERKTTIDDIWENVNPFLTNINEEDLQSTNNSFRQSTFFNRTNSKFGLEHTYLNLFSKVLLVSGFDQRVKSSHEAKIRVNISKQFTILSSSVAENKQSTSDYISGRNYDLLILSQKGTLRWQPNTIFRIALEGGYREKRNNPTISNLNAFITELGLDMKYNQLKKGSFNAQVKYFSMVYNGEGNSPIAYEMLESLQVGDNMTWTIGYQRTFANNLQWTINYSGRKSDDINAIHTGGMQLRAFF
jgi:hypothetical protein